MDPGTAEGRPEPDQEGLVVQTAPKPVMAVLSHETAARAGRGDVAKDHAQFGLRPDASSDQSPASGMVPGNVGTFAGSRKFAPTMDQVAEISGAFGCHVMGESKS